MGSALPTGARRCRRRPPRPAAAAHRSGCRCRPCSPGAAGRSMPLRPLPHPRPGGRWSRARHRLLRARHTQHRQGDQGSAAAAGAAAAASAVPKHSQRQQPQTQPHRCARVSPREPRPPAPPRRRLVRACAVRHIAAHILMLCFWGAGTRGAPTPQDHDLHGNAANMWPGAPHLLESTPGSRGAASGSACSDPELFSSSASKRAHRSSLLVAEGAGDCAIMAQIRSRKLGAGTLPPTLCRCGPGLRHCCVLSEHVFGLGLLGGPVVSGPGNPGSQSTGWGLHPTAGGPK